MYWCSDRLTLSAIMFRKASNTLSATAITHCIIPEMRRGSTGQEHQQKRTNPSYLQMLCLDMILDLPKRCRESIEFPYTLHLASSGINFTFVKTKNCTLI